MSSGKHRTCSAGFGCKRRLKKGERLFCSKCIAAGIARRESPLTFEQLYPGLAAWGGIGVQFEIGMHLVKS